MAVLRIKKVFLTTGLVLFYKEVFQIGEYKKHRPTTVRPVKEASALTENNHKEAFFT